MKLEKISGVKIFEYASQERKGKAIDYKGKEFIIPQLSDLKAEIFKKIYDWGFEKIEIVSPNKANCLIRIFQKLHYKYDCSIYNVYGVSCYVLKNGKWMLESDGDEFQLDYSKEKIKHWICQDDYIVFDMDFLDLYVRIS